MPQKGLFIVLEGPEGCGKSTQVDLLVQWLNKQEYQVIQTKEPRGQIREKLLNSKSLSDQEELALFLEDRQQHLQEITNWLNQSNIIICDRFHASTFAYQVIGRKIITPEEFDQRDREIVGDLLPDLSILLDIDPEIGFARFTDKQPDRIEQAGIDFHQQVRQGFLKFTKRRPKDNWIVIDASQSIDEIAKQIQHVIKPLLYRD